jgi:hypothetical protein
MQHKPDPKPGRWILPLIIIAMVGFTYVFTSSITPTLPDVTVAPADVASDDTTGPDASEDDAVITEDTAPTVDPEVTTYIAQLEGFVAELEAANTQLVDANAGWDARTIKYGETKTAFQEAAATLQTWSNSVSASLPPASMAALQLPHQDIIDATVAPVDEAKKALDGLVNSESTVPRREAIQRFSIAVDDFVSKVAAALAIANG